MVDNLTGMHQAIMQALPNFGPGSLCFWGDWFGRPHDNAHKLISIKADDDALVLTFDKEEQLSIWNPVGFERRYAGFTIQDAQQVLWQWTPYGEDPSTTPRSKIDYYRTEDRIVRKQVFAQNKCLDANEPAVLFASWKP